MSSATNANTHPPNGGLAAWSKVLGCFMIYINTWGMSTSFGVYQTHYQLETLKEYPPSTISWIGTIQVFLLMFISIASGALFDRGYGRTLFYVGCFLMVLGQFMLSLIEQGRIWEVFMAQSVCFGIGSGLVFVPAVAAAANEFTTKWPIANGIASTGSAVGGTVLPIAFRQLVPRVGFAWTNRIFGFIILTTSICAIFLLRPNSQKPQGAARPSDIGTELSTNGDRDGTTRSQSVQERRSKALSSYFSISAFKEPPYAFLCAGLFLVELGFWIPPFTITPYAQLYLNTGANYAFYLLAILNAGSFAGRILPALLAQKIRNGGPAWTLVAGCTSLGVLCLCWIAVHDAVGVTIWAVLTGFMSGIAVSIPNTVVTSLSSLKQTGTRSGMLWFVVAFAALVGAPIAGTLVDTATNSYKWGQVFSGLSICVGSVFLCVPAFYIMRKKID